MNPLKINRIIGTPGGQKNVLLTFNKAYMYEAGNLILSLNKYNDDLHFYLFVEKADEEIISYLFSLGAKIKLFDIEINYDLDTKGWNPAALIRLFAPFYLEDDIEKILYLDCDILCKDNIDELFSLNDDNCILAMPPDLGWGPNPKKRSPLFDDCVADLYCNSGVVLFYVKRYKAGETAESVCESYKSISQYLNFIDQDYLNYHFKGKIHFIKADYGLLIPCIKRYKYQKEIKYAKLLHFARKPWSYRIPYLMKKMYLKYSLEKHMKRKVRIAIFKGILYHSPLFFLVKS